MRKEMHILLAEEEDEMRGLLVQVLRREGHTVSAFGRGDDALRVFESDPRRIDLIIADYLMPGVDGLRLCTRALGLCPDLSVIIISGNPDSTFPAQVSAVGAQGFLKKPFTVQAVLDMIEHLAGTPA